MITEHLNVHIRYSTKITLYQTKGSFVGNVESDTHSESESSESTNKLKSSPFNPICAKSNFKQKLLIGY